MIQGSDLQNTRTAARMLGVPAAWLKREAHEGRVPCLKVGRRIRFNVDAVKAVLAERASRIGVDDASK